MGTKKELKARKSQKCQRDWHGGIQTSSPWEFKRGKMEQNRNGQNKQRNVENE